MAGILLSTRSIELQQGQACRRHRMAEPDVFYFPVAIHNFISFETIKRAHSRTRFAA
jgi:hypothetical protein